MRACVCCGIESGGGRCACVLMCMCSGNREEEKWGDWGGG